MIFDDAVKSIAYDEPDLTAAGNKGTIAGNYNTKSIIVIIKTNLIIVIFSGFGAREVLIISLFPPLLLK